MVGVEMFSTQKAEKFIEQYNGHEFKGQKVAVEWYNVRFNRFDKNIRRYKKENPEKGRGFFAFAFLWDDPL